MDADRFPVFVPPLPSTGRGVDFLGLRQANLDLRHYLLPGISNVTARLRVFAIMCWAAWRYAEYVRAVGTERPAEEARAFREKVEVLCVWGHQLVGRQSGLAGADQRPPPGAWEGEEVSLSFAAWGRNVSWMDPAQYGPALKTVGERGLLSSFRAGHFVPTEAGTRLARALDGHLQASPGYDALADVQRLTGRRELAESLYPCWRVDDPSAEEAESFLPELYAPDQVPERTALVGRRSATVALLLTTLRGYEQPLPVREVRQAMVYDELQREPSPDGAALHFTQAKWRVLQLRQAQRFALEAVFAWVDETLDSLDPRGVADTVALIANLRDRWGEDEPDLQPGWPERQLGRLQSLAGAQGFIAAGTERDELNYLLRLWEVERAYHDEHERYPALAVELLLLIAAITGEWLQQPALATFLGMGGRARISLSEWHRFVTDRASRTADRFLTDLLEDCIISQHFGVALRRFDQQAQKQRFGLEEQGLTRLVADAQRLSLPITGDHLASVLSLLNDCGVVHRSENGFLCNGA